MECDAVVNYLAERSIFNIRKRLDLVIAQINSLQIGFWCPREEYPTFDDIEDVRKTLDLDSIDILIVVSYRPYILIDYLNSLIERAFRWYGIKLGVKLLGVSSVELETGLEDALGRAMVEKPHKLGVETETEHRCPQCGKDSLKLYRSEKYFSRKYRGRVVESVFGCKYCSFRVRRVELLD
ncbi:MAG: hypothetical protein QXF78_00100 [Pyrobaculum sp.]